MPLRRDAVECSIPCSGDSRGCGVGSPLSPGSFQTRRPGLRSPAPAKLESGSRLPLAGFGKAAVPLAPSWRRGLFDSRRPGVELFVCTISPTAHFLDLHPPIDRSSHATTHHHRLLCPLLTVLAYRTRTHTPSRCIARPGHPLCPSHPASRPSSDLTPRPTKHLPQSSPHHQRWARRPRALRHPHLQWWATSVSPPLCDALLSWA